MKTKELAFLEDLEESIENDIILLRDRLKKIENRKKELMDGWIISYTDCGHYKHFVKGWCEEKQMQTSADGICEKFVKIGGNRR